VGVLMVKCKYLADTWQVSGLVGGGVRTNNLICKGN